MGDIADSIINGDFDYITGEYIGEGYGFPRTTNSNHVNKIQTSSKAVNGVDKFMCYFPKLRAKTPYERIDIIFKFNEVVLKLELPKNNKLQFICKHIQKDFGVFAKYIRERYDKNLKTKS